MGVKYKDYYQILGVERDASPDKIRIAYRKLAKKYHPDVNKGDAAKEEKFKEISEAHEALSDPEKRKRYDTLGANWQAGADFTPPPGFEEIFRNFGARRGRGGGGATFNFGSGGGSGGSGGFSDFFDMLFGGGLGGAFNGGGGGPSCGRGGGRFAMKGQDVQADLAITVRDAFTGGKKSVSFQMQNPDGSVRMKTFDINIPGGVKDGTTIRLAGQGAPGMNGAPAGDLLVTLRFAPDSLFKTEGYDVFVDVPVTPWDAALGAKVEVPTLGGIAELKIPAGVQGGQKLRMKQQGLPGRNGRKGDQFATVRIAVPKKLSKEEKRLFKELKEKSDFNPR